MRSPGAESSRPRINHCWMYFANNSHRPWKLWKSGGLPKSIYVATDMESFTYFREVGIDVVVHDLLGSGEVIFNWGNVGHITLPSSLKMDMTVEELPVFYQDRIREFLDE